MRRENIPYELITFEDEGHGIARPKNLRVLYPRLADFFHNAFQVIFLTDDTRRSQRSHPATHGFNPRMFKIYMCVVHISAEG